ncbi:prenyltransferase alpha subunit repeat-containing protein 1 [Pyrus ussuriensis x Pyrus communis]|uniref:Prenyltransferase alpha subunit repeat-containing protein 1 n=1 Tax=Pyrus ussuriensis x Pyrus communis TaxID=2448454 RepID=A0A5N5HE10_9ROSA|nr:prenyltransferase alpha subunit repeat-containing protein 1 [Pyrus ussuriensis x Pyrus communis]
MNEEELRRSEASMADLLNQFERILESDPQIDEVGFLHPSQFSELNKEVGHSSPSFDDSTVLRSADGNSVFWNRDHKLGISTQVLFPLYEAAKHAFMAASRQYKALNSKSDVSGDENSLYVSLSLDNSFESDVMKHSGALLLLSSDLGTAWHSRKLVVSQKHKLSDFLDELLLSALVLSYSPKSEYAWSHRQWVIKSIAGKCSTLSEIVTKDSELVEKIAERSKMNYRAWNHRCWLVTYMTREQLLYELKRSRNWASLHVADHSCFHYRSRLMLKILEEQCYKQEISSSGYNVETYQLWKEELDWDEMLIKRYIGREALWLHRRFLSLFWIKHFITDHSGVSSHGKQNNSMNNDFRIFMDNELHLLDSCSIIPDNSFDDYQAQAKHSATYILWLIKQIPDSRRIEFQEKLKTENLKALLNKACPERSSTWDSLVSYVEASGH